MTNTMVVLARWSCKPSATCWVSSSKATRPTCARPTPAKVFSSDDPPQYRRGPFNFGQYSDDTQLARELALSLLTTKSFVPKSFRAYRGALQERNDRRAWPGDRSSGAPDHRWHPVAPGGRAIAERRQRAANERGTRGVRISQPGPDAPHRRRFSSRDASRSGRALNDEGAFGLKDLVTVTRAVEQTPVEPVKRAGRAVGRRVDVRPALVSHGVVGRQHLLEPHYPGTA